MSPLIPIAINLLPELAKRVARGTDPKMQETVVAIVREVLGTDDSGKAAQRAQDSHLAGTLRLRLAEVENEAARQQLLAEREARAIAFRDLEARLVDKQDARSIMLGLNKQNSALAWGPVVVSVIVTSGFFAILITLIVLMQGGFGTNGDPADQMVLQIVNIAVGALTAGFATVVSFWLGSSDGSRQKDLNAVQVQSASAELHRETAQSTRDILTEQTRQNAAVLERVKQPGSAATGFAPWTSDTPRKDARQFARCLEIILAHEGGYVDHPSDPGGATNLGITHKTLAAWRGEPVTKAEVKALSRDEAGEIYRANYWNALNCDALPVGVDLLVFDFGVNAGVGRSAKLLQKLVHVDVDGQVGPITIAATKSIDARDVIAEFSDARMDYYRSLHHWNTFKNGWTRRTDACRESALGML